MMPPLSLMECSATCQDTYSSISDGNAACGRSRSRRKLACRVCGSSSKVSRSLTLPLHRVRYQQRVHFHRLWRPPVQDRLDDLRRVHCQPEDAGHVGWHDALARGQLGDRGELAEGPSQRLDERVVGLAVLRGAVRQPLLLSPAALYQPELEGSATPERRSRTAVCTVTNTGRSRPPWFRAPDIGSSGAAAAWPIRTG